MKKSQVFREYFILFLVIGLSILLAGAQFVEKNKVSDALKNEINQTGSLMKSGLAPENPEFVEYQKNKLLTQKGPSLDGHKRGLIPSPVDLHHLSRISQAGGSAPAHYDLRTLNKVTTVKDQGYAGSCWAFAAYGALESDLMSGKNRDFSENNLKNLLSNTHAEGFDFDEGGNRLMSTAYLTRWSGPVAESDDPYSDSSSYSPTGLPVRKHVQYVYYLSSRKGPLDNQEIKSTVQNYGAIDTSLYYDDSCYSPITHSYYFDGSSDSNHEVAIVGWNDSYNKNNFSRIPPGNGAFIVKNSWGTGWGENGYFYVSYYDSNIGSEGTIYKAENPDNYKYIYQYDPLGLSSCYGYDNSPTAWCANIFTARYSNEVLKAVGFYTTDVNSRYEIYIYTNPGLKPAGQANPVLTQKGTISNAGYHTVHLNSGVKLKAGQKFSVVLKLTTPNYDYPVPIEYPVEGYSSKATAHAGESFVSPDGKNWIDLTKDPDCQNTNVCIKAFTDLGTALPVANFSATPTSGYAPLTVSFADTSTGGTPTSWYWDLEMAQIQIKLERPRTHLPGWEYIPLP
jgi:C1A family cysteine protease